MSKMYTAEEIAKYLGIHRSTCLRYIKKVYPNKVANGEVTILTEEELRDVLVRMIESGRKILALNKKQKQNTETDSIVAINNSLSLLVNEIRALVKETRNLVETNIHLIEMLTKQKTALPSSFVSFRDNVFRLVNEYKQKNSLYDSLNDIFLELLSKFEKEENVKIRENYKTEDKNFIYTIYRLGFGDRFLAFLRKKVF